MRTLHLLITIATLFCAACAVPKPSASPVNLAEDSAPVDEEPECPDEECREICEAVPEDRHEACIEAYAAGCFDSEEVADFDCEEFEPVKAKNESLASPDGDPEPTELDDEDDTDATSDEKFIDAPDHE